MTEYNDITRVSAVYIGCGCFIRADGFLAFVKQLHRPVWLIEGRAYCLKREYLRGGAAIYFVEGEAV